MDINLNCLQDDPVHGSSDQLCMNFVRTVTGPRIDCKPGPAEQVWIKKRIIIWEYVRYLFFYTYR